MPDTATYQVELLEPDATVDATGLVDRAAKGVLEATALRATFWTVMDYGCSMALRIVNSLVLTRLLMPESFGLMTLVSTLVAGVSLMSDIGLGPSVIQSSRGDDPVLLNTVWTLQVLRGVGIFAASLLIAWPLSLIYHEPRLISLLPALGISTLISAFNSTNLLSMSRHLGVRRVFLLDISTQIFTLLVTSLLAYRYKSVWALVAGTILSAAFKLLFSHNKRAIPGIRNSFRWDRQSVNDVVHFGKWILLATPLFFFASQADRLVLGRLVSMSMLGVYGIAYAVSDIPRAIVNAFSNKVGFPFIAKMVHLPITEFRLVFLQYRLKALLAGAFLLCVMVHLGGFFVTRMYDSRYHAASWMVPILALGLWHTLLYTTTFPALLSLGKPQYGTIGNACYCVSVVTAIFVAFHFYGLVGAVIAVAAGDFPLYLVMVIGASREGISTWRQDLRATGVFLALLAVGAALRVAIVR